MPCRNDCGKPGCRKDYHPGEPCSNQTKLQFDEEIVAEKARKAGKSFWINGKHGKSLEVPYNACT